MMAGGGAGAVATGVLVGMPAYPTVVTFCPADLWHGSRIGAGETGNILEGCEHLAVAQHERGGEGDFCGGERCH